MLYTVGRTAEYLVSHVLGVRSQRPPCKLGRRACGTEPSLFGTRYHLKPYPGGSVWAVREDAQAYLDTRGLSRFSVFGVDATAEQSADPWEPGATWRDLLVDAPIVLLELEYYADRTRQEAQFRRDHPSIIGVRP
ncbi:MAG: hypothetical protein ABMA64_01130 [Myxococcota bacterium]